MTGGHRKAPQSVAGSCALAAAYGRPRASVSMAGLFANSADVLLGLGELARSPAGQPRGGGGADRQYEARGGCRSGAELDENEYSTGVKVSDEELAAVCIRRSQFHGD